MTQSTAEIRHVVARTGFANPLTLGVLVEDADYLKVYADLELLQVGVDYTVTGIGDANGVSVEIIGAEDVNEYVGYESFTALYDPVLQQGADLSLGGNFGRAFESALDSQNRQLQAVAERAYAVSANTNAAAESALLAEAAADAAELAADAAEDAAAVAAAGAGTQVFSSVAAASVYSPAVAPDFILTAGFAAAGDYGGALYKKVASEPSHYGKLSITLSGGGTVWYENAEPEVHIAMLGAKMDAAVVAGVISGTDDADAVERAYGVGRPVKAGPGRVRLGHKLSLNTLNNPIILEGTGAASTFQNSPHDNTTTFIMDHADAAGADLGSPSLYQAYSSRITGIEWTGRATGAPDNQHGLVIKGPFAWSKIECTFTQLSGYGIAFDPTSNNNYAQNLDISGCRFLKVGGMVGLTQEPAASASYLACTLLLMNNVNLDHSVNAQSPQRALLDFRAMREVVSDLLLTEGNGASALTDIMQATTDVSIHIDTWHVEFQSNAPPYDLAFLNDPTNKFFSTTETRVQINTLDQVSVGKIRFESGVEAMCEIRDWYHFAAVKDDDLATFADTTGYLGIENLQVQTPWTVDIGLLGQLDIVSWRRARSSGPVFRRVPRPVASWRPGMGAPLTFNGHLLSFTAASNTASNTITDDDVDTRLQVCKVVSNVGFRATIFPTITTPYDWFRTTLNYDTQTANFTVGSILTGGTSGAKARIMADTDGGSTGTLKLKPLTAANFSAGEIVTDAAGGSATVNGAPTKISPQYVMVVRWKAVLDAADIASGIRQDASSIGGSTIGTILNYSGLNKSGEYQDTIYTFRATSASPVGPSWAVAGGTPASAISLFLAGIDVYVGTRYSEILDLSYQ